MNSNIIKQLGNKIGLKLSKFPLVGGSSIYSINVVDVLPKLEESYKSIKPNSNADYYHREIEKILFAGINFEYHGYYNKFIKNIVESNRNNMKGVYYADKLIEEINYKSNVPNVNNFKILNSEEKDEIINDFNNFWNTCVKNK